MSKASHPRNPDTAYHNQFFLDSEEGRPLRILAEYLEPLQRLKQEGVHDIIVFFGSARIKETDPLLGKYYHEARELAARLTTWAAPLQGSNRFVVCSGGGGGIMEAANRGARDAGGQTIGFNIGLPHEQRPNPYISPALLFEFHYFFMRKLWFTHLARALIVFPGGFGTLDELMETLTLVQTQKIDRKILILLYGNDFWRETINFEALAQKGMINPEDLHLFHQVDSVEAAFKYLTANLPTNKEPVFPAIAKATYSQK